MFPATFAFPVLIVQHMPPVFTRLLAERLQKLSPLTVTEAQQGCPLEPGKIFVAPGDFHLRVRKVQDNFFVALDQSLRINSCRPSVDALFESAHQAFGGAVVAAILTGMGEDGLRGTATLKLSGAYVVVQDEASSVVWGMPGAVAKAGLADAVVPLEKVVPAILDEFGFSGCSASSRKAL